MPLFGPKPIPTTSYGYEPPPGATAVGWACLSHDCGVSEHEPVKRWPKACPRCGSATDPLFNPPWKHDALGVELQYKIRNKADGFGFYEDQWEAWQFEDAVLRGDRAGMAQARASVRAYTQNKLSAESWWFPGNVFFHFTWHGLKARDLDGTADDLLYWIGVSSLEDVENNNSNRTNSCQVIDQVDQFLQAGGASHPKAEAIRQGSLQIAAAAWPILTYVQQDAVKRMTRSEEKLPMGLHRRHSQPGDLITSEDLAQYGRYKFLGAEPSGIPHDSADDLISSLNELVYTQKAGDRARIVAELRRHADEGEWEKVGAWKYVREFLDEAPDTLELIDGGLLAIDRMRVTNLSIHLASIDMPRYAELTGGPPPDDGFFGPPVFDSNYGPPRQYYFDQAIATAAARRITRIVSAPGVEPGPMHDAARAAWDFGLLVYRGPLVVNPDIQFEPNVVRPLVQAATGVDHALFAERLADAVLDTKSYAYGPWSSIGGARFVEEYLDSSAVESEGYRRLMDAGLTLLREGHLIGLAFSHELLTPPQQDRLNELSTRTAPR